MDKDLYDSIKSAVKDRSDWADKQSGAYRLRYGGIKRTNKPYPNAPDMHYPLADSDIDKLKPLFIQQLYANETLAQFVATCQQNPSDTQSASEWFDYQVKQQSNFEREIYSAVDQFLEAGFITVKVFWAEKRQQVRYSTCDNLYVIVPKWTEELQDADWLVHVLHLSEAQYRANPLYNHDDDLIKEIKGKGNSSDSDSDYKDTAIELREGITCGTTDDEIVLWEVYRKTDSSSDATWMVDTISPLKGYDTAIRPSFGLPFDHGMLPFFRIRCEITKKGWYTSRGIPELMAPYQLALKKIWDGSLQFLDYAGVPTYQQTAAQTVPNWQNFEPKAGGILPPGIEPVQSLGAPIDFEKQMGLTRAIAEDRIAIPDLGSSQHLRGKPGVNGDVTATQVNAVVGQSSQSNDLRARVFRLDLADGYKMTWLVLLQYKKDAMQYLLDGEMKQVPETALHEKYIIQPSGSADTWNRAQQFGKAVTRFQLFKGDPFINQGELRKDVLSADQSSLVKRLYQDPEQASPKQAEQQAVECVLMMYGWPAAVSQADDDKVHLVTEGQFVQRRLAQNEPITPELARLLLKHGSDHFEALKAKKDPALIQITQQMLPIIQILQAIANQPDQPRGAIQDPQMQGQALPAPQTGDGQKQSQNQPNEKLEMAKVAVNGIKALNEAAKNGVGISQQHYNAVFRQFGLPDLPIQPVQAPARQV